MESLFVSAACSSYMSCLGYSLEADNQQAINEAFVKQIADFCAYHYDLFNQSQEQINEVIGRGCTIVKNGVIQLSHEACDVLKRFSDWVIEKCGFLNDDGSVNTGPVTVYSELSGVTPVSNKGIVYPIYDHSAPPAIAPDNAFVAGESYYWNDFHGYYLYLSNVGQCPVRFMSTSISYDKVDLIIGVPYSYAVLTVGQGNKLGAAVYDEDRQLVGTSLSNSGPYSFWGEASGWMIANQSLSLSLSPDYEAAPTVDEQYAMVIDTGMTFEDEQEMIDGILGGIVAGTLSPTYAIEQTTAGDVTVPGEDTEDDTPEGILSWTKKIWQSVTELPQTIADKFASIPQAIADAIAAIFVPDAELCAEITDTFSAKFDFISTLHGLGTDLLNLNPDQTPPVIYIYLNDAQSNYGFDYGGTTKALDMAWYEPYKDDVDRIISGFLWLGFLWLCFMRASDIINGAGMVYAAGQPTIYTPDSPHDAPRLEAPRWRRRGR